ncbi:hypothetical protein ACQJBY_032478 [Aegilops geniculata]
MTHLLELTRCWAMQIPALVCLDFHAHSDSVYFMGASSGRPAALGSLASGHPKKETTWSPLERKRKQSPARPRGPPGPARPNEKGNRPPPAQMVHLVPARRSEKGNCPARQLAAGSRAPSSPNHAPPTNCTLAIFFFLAKEGSAQVAESFIARREGQHGGSQEQIREEKRLRDHKKDNKKSRSKTRQDLLLPHERRICPVCRTFIARTKEQEKRRGLRNQREDQKKPDQKRGGTKKKTYL